MKKSEKRLRVEHEIDSAHRQALAVGLQMVQEEFGGRLEDALADQLFVNKMHHKIGRLWEIYRGAYKKLEDLEVREGYPAMHAYANELDLIAQHLPLENRVLCYYPFSGVDFYWARIFRKVIFEDNAFYEKDQPSNISSIWWSLETYSLAKRNEIISILKNLKIIQETANMQFFSEDVEICKDMKKFNNHQSTLLIKGGSDVLAYIDKRFSEESLEYGTVIIGSSINPLSDMEERLARDGYRKHFSLDGEDFLAPYAMKLKDIHIFLKNA